MRMMQKKYMHVCLSLHRKGKSTFQDSSNMNLHQFRLSLFDDYGEMRKGTKICFAE